MNFMTFQTYLKKDNPQVCILFKKGYFYQIYNQDALIISYLFGFKLSEMENGYKKAGFPLTQLDRVKEKLNIEKINYIIWDDINNVYEKKYKHNKYSDLLKIIKIENYKNDKLSKLVEKIKQKMVIDENILSRIEELL